MTDLRNQIDIKVSRKVFNERYLPYLEDQTRNQDYFGGSSSGKSHFVVGQRTVWDLMKGDRNYLILRNVARTSRTSTFNQVKQVISDWNVSHLFKINKSDLTVTCINGYQALFEGLDNVEKLKSIKPDNGVITDIILEEATETKKEDTKQLKRRLRGKSKYPKRFVKVFNPILKSHWIYEDDFKGRFYDGDKEYRDERYLIVHTTYKDNLKFLDPEDVYELENETDKYWYDVYTLGLWGILGNIIFTNWKVEDLSLDIPFYSNIRNGLDFGYSNDPAAYNRMHLDIMRKRLYIFDEFHVYNATNPVLAGLLRPIIGYGRDGELITCDSAEPKSIQELKDHQINAVGAVKGKDSVNYGIQWLKQFEIIIHRECQETINEFSTFHWKELKDGTILNVPIDKDNHHIDGIRYACESDMADANPRAKAGIKVVKEKKGPEYTGDSKLEEVKKKLRKGDELVPIYEGDELVDWEIIRRGNPNRRGISGRLR